MNILKIQNKNRLFDIVSKGIYSPSMYEVHTEAYIKEEYRTFAHSGINLYKRIYNAVLPYLFQDSTVLDFGAYPGTFLRLLKHLHPKTNLIGSGLICEKNEVSKYSERVSANSMLNVKVTESNFINILKQEGIDFINCNLDQCFSNLHSRSLNSNCENSCIENLYGSVDIIVCMETIEHLHTPYRLFDLCFNLLKPGGFCIIETNNIKYLGNIYRLFSKGSNLDPELADNYVLNNPSIKHPHIRFYSLAEISKLFEIAQLQVIEKKDFTWDIPLCFLKRSKKIYAKSLLKKLLSIPGFRSHIIVTARKKQF